MRVFVEVQGWIVTVDCDGSDTVLALRAMVAEACNIEEASFYVSSPWEDLTEDTLDSLGIVDSMTIRTATLLTIFVDCVWEGCLLHTSSDTRVGHVKHLVFLQTGVPVKHQCLLCGMVEMKDNDRLDEYISGTDSVLQLVR